MSYSSENKRTGILLGENSNALTWLIILNTVFFAFIAMMKLVYFFADFTEPQYLQQVVNTFALPSSFGEFLSQPWSLFTFMVSEYSVWSLIVSLLWLWAFGIILQSQSGNKALIPVYLYGGLVGGIVFLIAHNVIPGIVNNTGNAAYLLGAGSSVMAVAIATTTIAPQYRLFPMLHGGIPLWIITLVYVAINLGISGNSGATLIASLAAAAVGYLFMKQWSRGNDYGAWLYRMVDKIDGLFNPDKKLAAKRNEEVHFYRATTKPFEKKTTNVQQKLDDILDKIHQKGYQRLSEEEKEFLKKVSQEENMQ